MDTKREFETGLREDSVDMIKKRIHDKIKDYENYSFNSVQDCSLKTFFDLAQEFNGKHDIYCICVLIPKIFFEYECALYLIDVTGELRVACNSEDIFNSCSSRKFKKSDLYKEPVVSGDSFLVPVKGNIAQSSDLPENSRNGILGIFEICNGSKLSDNMKFFFEKYANRVGFHLHNRMINEKNREHLAFIRSLVNDIGHNIIVPNMFFKLFFRRLHGKINRAGEIGTELKEKINTCVEEQNDNSLPEIKRLVMELDYINNSMDEQFQQILSHYEQTSLFLETLLRRSHFEQGRYVLEPKLIDINEKIIKPQLSRYLPRLEEKGISIDNQVAVNPDKEIQIVADVGLISQAYANLFSNAVKYTREVSDGNGNPDKYISFGMKVIPDFFGTGKPGVKLNMFSTGEPLSKEDAGKLFDEGYRGTNTDGEYGTGHGLQFIKEVVELHNGVVGYESLSNGNDFYFVLPE